MRHGLHIWNYDPLKIIFHKETSQHDDLEIKKQDIKVFNYASQSQEQLFWVYNLLWGEKKIA